MGQPYDVADSHVLDFPYHFLGQCPLDRDPDWVSLAVDWRDLVYLSNHQRLDFLERQKTAARPRGIVLNLLRNSITQSTSARVSGYSSMVEH